MPRLGVGLTFGFMAFLTATDEKVKAYAFLYTYPEKWHTTIIKNAKLKSQQDKMGNSIMKDMSQVKSTLAFKVKAKRQWKVLSNKKELQELCGPEKKINLDDVRAFLEHTKTYYLNKYGLTIQMNGKRVTKQDSTYQFARLDEYTKGNREPIFAWSKKKRDGGFGCANFGTRYDFDCIIVNSIN